jgi:hypothetical protein
MSKLYANQEWENFIVAGVLPCQKDNSIFFKHF